MNEDNAPHVQHEPPLPFRFVVLRHECVASPHFDLMFETEVGSKLTTWRSDRWPIDRPTVLTRIGDHRPDYLTYEGPLSDNRGQVKRIAGGRCMIERLDDDTVWRIEVQDPLIAVLTIKQGLADQWLAVPACGG